MAGDSITPKDQNLSGVLDQLRQMQQQIDQMKASITGIARAEAEAVVAKITIQGDDMISFSGQFPNVSASIRKLPAVTWQGSAVCVDGKIVITLTGG